jgi:ABC-type transport system involved in multi-copper enzyme maturation permease subunit
MLWIITKKQVLINLLSYRFVVGFILCQVLFVLASTMLVTDYEERVRAYGEAVSRSSRELAEVKVFSQLSPVVHRAPARLSPICTGFDKVFASNVRISYTDVPRLEVGRQEKNALLAALKSLDLVGVIQIVLGLLVLLFAHDAVSGERERGTLALSLSGAVPRHLFLLGQYLGGMITVTAVFLVGLLLAVLMMLRSSALELGAADWMRLVLIGFSSLVYLSALYLLGLVASILSRRSATSLVILLFFWIVFIVIYPNLTSAVASKLDPVPARGVVMQQAYVLRNEFWTRIYDDSSRSLPQPPHKWEFIKERRVFSGGLPYPISIAYAPREIMEWELEGLRRYLPLHMEYAGKVHSAYSAYEHQLQRQAGLAATLARFSPAWTYHSLTSTLAGTHSISYLAFLERTRNYRHQLIQYVESKDGLLSHRYFTRLEPNRFRTTAELELMQSRGMRLEQELGEGFKPLPPLDLRDLPPFQFEVASVKDSLLRGLPDLAGLFAANVLLFLVAHLCFLRTDVRVAG